MKSSPGNPTTNAFVERANGTIKRALYGYLQKTGDDPITHLREFTDSINLVKNETTKVVPDVAVLPKYQEQIIKNQKNMQAKRIRMPARTNHSNLETKSEYFLRRLTCL